MRYVLLLLLCGCTVQSLPVLSPGQAAASTVEWVLVDPSNRRFVALPDGTWHWSERVRGINSTFWVERRAFKVDPSLTIPYTPLPRG